MYCLCLCIVGKHLCIGNYSFCATSFLVGINKKSMLDVHLCVRTYFTTSLCCDLGFPQKLSFSNTLVCVGVCICMPVALYLYRPFEFLLLNFKGPLCEANILLPQCVVLMNTNNIYLSSYKETSIKQTNSRLCDSQC